MALDAEPRRRRIRRPRLAFLLIGGAVGASAAALAVPTVQGLVVWRTRRPPVPGPHLQDGLMAAAGGSGDPIELVWLGDSLASGVGAGTPDTSFPRKAAALCSGAEGGLSLQLTCLARPGACAADVLAEQIPLAVSRIDAASVAVVSVGANDVGSFNRPRRFRRDYTAILQALTASGATVIAVGLPHMGSAAVMARPLRTIVGWIGRHADRQIRRLAEANGATYVHIAVRAPWGTHPSTYLAADKWHPNDATYNLWARRVAARLTALLSARLGPVH